MPTALFVSPHLDDAAFSCGGTAARLSSLGWRVVLCTVFTATVPNPRGFALACQTDKGVPAAEDYMALRRAEDEDAAAALGAEAIWLGHPEAPHRGYESARELFAGAREEDAVHEVVSRNLAALARSLSPALIFAPQGLGGHVDHLQTIRALKDALETDGTPSGLRPTPLYYRDTPYAIREPESAPSLANLSSMVEVGVGIESVLETKLRACAFYCSQLDFQFGGREHMREALTRFASFEDSRLKLGEPAEACLCLESEARALRSMIGKLG